MNGLRHIKEFFLYTHTFAYAILKHNCLIGFYCNEQPCQPTMKYERTPSMYMLHRVEPSNGCAKLDCVK